MNGHMSIIAYIIRSIKALILFLLDHSFININKYQ